MNLNISCRKHLVCYGFIMHYPVGYASFTYSNFYVYKLLESDVVVTYHKICLETRTTHLPPTYTRQPIEKEYNSVNNVYYAVATERL